MDIKEIETLVYPTLPKSDGRYFICKVKWKDKWFECVALDLDKVWKGLVDKIKRWEANK